MYTIKEIPHVRPELRISLYYFVQAMSVGAINAFAGLWLASQGISEQQVGIIFAVPIIVTIGIGIFIGRLADRAKDWRDIIIGGAVLSALFPIALIGAVGFWQILLVWTLMVTAQMVILPVADAAALRLTRRRGSNFSHFFAWKTVGYLAVILVSGLVIERFGTQAFLPLFVGFSLLRGLLAFGLPRFRAAPRGPSQPTQKGLFLKSVPAWFALPLVAWSLINSTHLVLNGYLGLVLFDLGYSAAWVGGLIAFSGVAETAMFLVYGHLAKRLSARTLILISCLAGIIRWIVFSSSAGIELIVFAQLLHALTYALGMLACTNFIADWADESVAAEAQSSFGVVQSVMGTLALVGFGGVYASFGALAFLLPASLACVGAIMVMVSQRLKADADR